jgi:S1-C subfamily serine protease
VLLLGLLGLSSDALAGLVDVIARAKRSVVPVGTYSAVESPRFHFNGTGFVIGDRNLLITAAHVVSQSGMASESDKTGLVIQVPASAGSIDMRQATVVALDSAHDLALLRFEGNPLPPLALAAAGAVHEGLSIAFIGFPLGGALGFTPVTHRGIISSITAVALPAPTSQRLNATAVQRLRNGSFDIYQLDATAYPGNSGGPVLDAETGQVVGVINMVLIKGAKESALNHPTGITYAIPSLFIEELLKRR